MTGRSEIVTGDEPGSCKVLTGTPYAGLDQINDNCSTEISEDMKSRSTVNSGNNSNARLTGQQPGIGGVMTGAKKGACKNLTGTPYVGGDQLSQACDNPPHDAAYANPESRQVTLGTNSLLNLHQEINILKKILKELQVMNMKMVQR